MQLKRLKINNFVGIPAADIEFDRPVSLFVGKNNQGKSSVKDAIEFAFTGKCRGLAKFNEVGNLVHGDKGMGVELDYIDIGSGEINTIKRTASTASRNVNGQSVLRYCLNPHEFIRLQAKERGRVLAEVLGGGMNDVIKAAIADHVGNINETLLAEIKSSGVDILDVDALREEVVTCRRQYKRDLKELPEISPVLIDYELEENYDVVKDEKAIKTLGDRIAKGGEIIAEAKRQLEIKAELIDIEKAVEKARKQIKKVPELPKDVSADDVRMASVFSIIIEDLLNGSKAASIKCPLSDGSHKRESLENRKQELEEWLGEYQDKLIEIDNIKTENHLAEQELRHLDSRRKELNQKFKSAEYKEGSEDLLKTLTAERDGLQANIANYRRFKAAESEYEQAEMKAKKLDELIEECDRIDTTLKDGGPVKAAISTGGRKLPINENLLRLWKMSALTWSDNGEIGLGALPIEYASNSEQYRAGCVMALALAEVSGTGIAALDDFEVLDPDNSNAFFKVVNECNIKNVLVFASSDKDYSQVDIPGWLRVFQVARGKVIATS